MASITMYTFLMVKGTGSTYEEVCHIKDYPDLIPQREQVETTDLAKDTRTYVPGIRGQDGSLDFTINLETTYITTLQSLEGVEKDYAVWMGGTAPATAGDDPTPTGDILKVGGKGILSYHIAGKGVNDVREAVIHITPTTDWAIISA